MNNRYIKPATGFTLGGMLGWLAVEYAQHNTDWEVNAPAYAVAIFAFAMIGGFVGDLCNTRIDPNSPEELTKRNAKTLKQLEKVFKQKSVPLLTPQEFRDYKILVQNSLTQEISEINLKIANYQAAVDALCPFTANQSVQTITAPITITKIAAIATATTYDYNVLKALIEQNMTSSIMEHSTELEINSTNFSFSRNYVPEIMDFIKEVRAILQHRANMSEIYRQNPSFLTFNQMPKESKYDQLILSNNGLESAAIAELRF